jgi:hypothetical protein
MLIGVSEENLASISNTRQVKIFSKMLEKISSCSVEETSGVKMES